MYIVEKWCILFEKTLWAKQDLCTFWSVNYTAARNFKILKRRKSLELSYSSFEFFGWHLEMWKWGYTATPHHTRSHFWGSHVHLWFVNGVTPRTLPLCLLQLRFLVIPVQRSRAQPLDWTRKLGFKATTESDNLQGLSVGCIDLTAGFIDRCCRWQLFIVYVFILKWGLK